MTDSRVLRPIRSRAILTALMGIAAAVGGAGCGFEPHPKSGSVACASGGTECCPTGYVCVGRGTSIDGGVSPGTCWYKDDLPPSALATLHDRTPAIPNDPVCLLTDWLPPGSGAAGPGGERDAGGPDLGGSSPAGSGGTGSGIDSGLGPAGTGGTGGGPDPGVDAPPVEDVVRDVPVLSGDSMEVGATDSAPTRDAPTPGEAPAGEVSAEVAGIANDGSADLRVPATGDAPADTPGDPRDAGPDSPATGDAPADAPSGDETGVVDGGGVTSISAGGNYTCAVVDGAAWCWGDNVFSTLGDGTSSDRNRPVRASGLQSGVTAVAAGGNHTCAVVAGGLKCWGINYHGEIGDGSTTRRYTPVSVSGLTSGVTAVSAGE
jgi:hypothetical protein